MKSANVDTLPWNETRSPKGRFHLFRRNLSQALGGKRDVGEWGGGHPFDVEEFRIPPGAANFPFHAHSAQWEFYLITGGAATVRTDDGETLVAAGGTFLFPPGETHQITNTGTEDLVMIVIADNPRADVVRYPDSGKWGIKPQREFFDLQCREYYDGEE